eukprot:CAMPEP_0181460734 /NCGR_PEP_ID=MMETSP1110-20121109/33498_1 /TAXON_ID=174948 /ORGANISM="Symbiodinium sp., Strain CCMP421" /LENGTH=354 /DNA_ID=CAMNT_0023585303 /DNA_START=80 /DNA_END=1141 /DNA_ORIENTATION=-
MTQCIKVLALLCLSLCESKGLRRSLELETAGRLQSEFPFYHTTEELHSEAARLVEACSHPAALYSRRKDYVEIQEVRVGSNATNKVSLLFGEHSRELIGPETALMLLKMLCGEHTEKSSLVAKALEDSQFQLILNANPGSRVKVEQGEYCLRANPNGVDLNRNWDEKWDLGSGPDHGPKPFSEPETQVVRDMIVDFKPTTFLSVHSGTLGLYMPWAYDSEHLAQRNRQAMLSVLQELDAAHCKCPFGAAGKEVGYDCPGTSFDWVYDNLKTPFSFAWEIYANPIEGDSLRARWEEKVAMVSLLQGASGEISLAGLYEGLHSDFMGTAELDAAKADACFGNFNPGTEADYNQTVV